MIFGAATCITIVIFIIQKINLLTFTLRKIERKQLNFFHFGTTVKVLGTLINI